MVQFPAQPPTDVASDFNQSPIIPSSRFRPVRIHIPQGRTPDLSTHATPNTPSAAPLHPMMAGMNLSIRDFLTDGSLARMCDELSRVTGVPIWLKDRQGMVIVPGAGSDAVSMPWRVLDGHEGARRAHDLVSRPYDPHATLFIAPIRTSIGDIGSICMPADWMGHEPQQRRALERAVTILASTGIEHVEGMLILRERVDALDALFRLSSLLVKADEPDKVLQTALDLALEALHMEAGSISVFEEPAALGSMPASSVLNPQPPGMVHKAVRNLSPQWLSEHAPLSIDGQLRAAALQGEVIAVTDLSSDPRIADHSRPASEGLVSLISTGLIFGSRASGLIRLYSRSLREFAENEKSLLRSIADHAAMTLAHTQLRKLREQDTQLRRQLKLAADVQQRMLPRKIPEIKPFDIAARYAPSHQLGGDFYDAFECQGSLSLAIGDVVGKGVPAALIMSAVRASLRAYADVTPELSQVMTKLNLSSCRDTLDSEFVTLALGMIDPQSLMLTYCSAGHDPALLFTPGKVVDGAAQPMTISELFTGGMALGIDDQQTYEHRTIQLEAGQVLVMHTDGLTDATDFHGQRFGHQRVRQTVLDLLSREPQAPAGRIVEHLMWTVRQFAGVRLSNDDITLVVVRVQSENRD